MFVMPKFYCMSGSFRGVHVIYILLMPHRIFAILTCVSIIASSVLVFIM